ncbi:ATP-binding cassette domain-containing protein [Asaia prunellae]|uniref:ATP-binding cassette domain-containing protein n=1 Tax=Asaia prunellae TaxID=610245 RepID=UPI0004702731|nr:ATP-binding cassette domain-containing protein [Asaia prunellae]
MTLALTDISVMYQGRFLLDKVSLSLSPGELVAVIGPNGAGKSTLMRVAAGLLTPCNGLVEINSLPLDRYTPRKLASVRAMLTQDQTLEARFSVRELARFGVPECHRSEERERLAQLVGQTLDEVGLGRFIERDVTTLSGGERQRAHLSRVLVQLRWHGDNGYLLLDEPVSAQDIAHQGLILSLARAHTGKGGACLAILHDLNWAAAFADRIVVLDKGRIYDSGPVGKVITSRMLFDVFGLSDTVLGHHHETGRPFLLPHDLMLPGSS